MAKRGTKAYEQEIVWVFYGINPTKKRVERVSQQRNGVLSKMNDDAVFVTHYVMPGRKAETEIVIVFGLTDVFGVPVSSADSEWVKKQVAELEAKARAT
ncbi:hypothetical protein DFH01_01925 [Falsiroseomonas bella]|uniref:Uncharacterized protein n=1 Tax=Falsiroseomonas bella TaxID=2184016 RepID=A0A317FKF8_9PROT|nr:hypothetical protein [Falsiroseomonas bella]PWS38086.1 hypothetical protein DFH01_01925 [Falsiroseomonas bella]